MIVDAVDLKGRRYLEVPVFPAESQFLAMTNQIRASDPCVECGHSIRHGYERYFQRNDVGDGAEGGLEGLLLAMTYDAVCGDCGDRILREDSM